MKRKRRTWKISLRSEHSRDKTKIVLAAMKGEKTINEIAQLDEFHPK